MYDFPFYLKPLKKDRLRLLQSFVDYNTTIEKIPALFCAAAAVLHFPLHML